LAGFLLIEQCGERIEQRRYHHLGCAVPLAPPLEGEKIELRQKLPCGVEGACGGQLRARPEGMPA
jgi:hypothetical protein